MSADRQRDEEYRREIAATREAFDEYAATFQTDVAAMRDHDIAETRRRFAAAGEAFRAYVEAFRADVARRVEDREATRAAVTAYVEQFHEAVATRRETRGAVREAFERYAEEFEADVATKRSAPEFTAAVAGLREELAATRSDLSAYADEFDADVRELRATFAAARDALDEYVADVADVDPDRVSSLRDAAASVDAGEATTTTATATADAREDDIDSWGFDGAERTAGATDADDSADVATEPTDDLGAEAETETGNAFDGAEVTTAESGAGSDPTSPAPDERLQLDDANDADAAGRDQAGTLDPSGGPEDADETAGATDADAADGTLDLEDVPYGTLKKAANVMGYEDNLNAATKEDLIEFFEAQDPDEIRSLLG